MGFDQKGTLVFRVARDKTGVWNVQEEGYDQPLASFDTSEDAREYVLDIAKSKDGSIVKMNETDSIYDETNCQEKTLTGILMLLQKCSSTPKPVGFEDRVLTESDSFSFKEYE